MRRSTLAIALVVLATLVPAACGQPTPTPVVLKETVVVEKIVERQVEVTPEATPAPDELSGTLIVGRGGDSVSLDAGTATDGESWRVGQEIIEPLTRLEGTTTKVIPWLATGWETTDSKTWVFRLRQGVRFHDGSPFNAEAVRWNIERWRDPNNQYRFGRQFEYYDSEFGENFNIDDVSVLGEYTIQITLHQPSAVLLAKLSLHTFAINSPKAVMEQGDKYGTPAGTSVGTGPFRFVEWIPGDHITLERNVDWWGGPPRQAHLPLHPR